jgi:hypothetical protein
MARAQPEAAIQRSVLEYLASVAPQLVVYANPNASRRTASGRASNAVPGLRKGVHDLTILSHRRVHYVEVKAPKGKMTPEQCEFADALDRLSISWWVVRSIDDMREALKWWGLETRERAAS